MVTEVAHEGLKLVTTDCGGAGAGGIGEPEGDGGGILDCPALDGLALLVGGKLLAVAAGVTEVSGEGMGDGEVIAVVEGGHHL